ncbi:MAG TPA: NADPH:quinone oxidoreductase family protein [Bryobacteraceae bacterium]|nr:NADPH:quinone oxidoreductase family protein [Bryobacteraceae bacterium]
MRVWQVPQYGEPEQMVLTEAPSPEPRENGVRVRVHAAALNFFDLLLVQGKYQARPAFPFTPGAEAAGVITAAGAAVRGLNAGDRVIVLPSNGCFAEELVCPAARVLPIPEGMDFETAAAMPVVYQTSWFGLVDRARLQAGEWLLVLAGASGVGMSAIQIGKALGARVIATASTAEKLDFCRAQGAEAAFHYGDPSWVEGVKHLTGRGADVIYDPVGGDIFDLSTKCMASMGRLVVIGFTSGRIPSIAANRLLLKNISVVGAIWGNWCTEHPEYIHETHEKLAALWKAGVIAPVIGRRYALEELPQGLRDLGNRGAMGKAVVVIP